MSPLTQRPEKRPGAVWRLLALAGTTALTATLVASPAAQAGEQATPDAAEGQGQHGLYGAQDPTYDGAFRQSLSLIALVSAGRRPAPEAVRWLTGQQCADGGWTAFRPDTSKPCDPKREDTNSTAMAVQALVALRATSSPGSGQVGKNIESGLTWLGEVRNPDGGVGYNPGGATDANSTALLVNAMLAAGHDPSAARNAKGNSPVDALLDLRVGCDAPAAQRGAFAFQPDQSGALYANDSSTAAALLGLSEAHLPVGEATSDVGAAPAECQAGETAGVSAAEASGAAAHYLTARLEANDGTIPPLQGKEPDYFTTANAGVALAAAGQRDAADTAARALARDVDAYVVDERGDDQPAALASLVLLAEATNEDPADFGGADITARLAATGPPAPPTGRGAAGPGATQDAESGAPILMTVGGILAAAAAVAAGIGLARRRRAA